MIFDRWREKRNQKIEEKLEDQRKQAEEQARSSVASYTSRKAILRKSLPMIFLGGVLAAVELLIIGALYTLVSLLIYMPLLYFYTKSVRPVRGKYLGEVSHSGGHMKINRYLVPDELFELIDFGKPIAPATIEINGHEGYLATKVLSLSSSAFSNSRFVANSTALSSTSASVENFSRLKWIHARSAAYIVPFSSFLTFVAR